jgi:hypothetical protein
VRREISQERADIVTDRLGVRTECLAEVGDEFADSARAVETAPNGRGRRVQQVQRILALVKNDGLTI